MVYLIIIQTLHMLFEMVNYMKFLHYRKLKRFILMNYGELEAFHTSGGTSTLTKSFPNVETLEYKTIRYKGHAEKFKLLVDLGLTNKVTRSSVDGK